MIIRDTWLSKKPHPLAAFTMSLFLLITVLLSGAYWENFYQAQDWMAATKYQVFNQHEYWRAFTTLFVHGDGKHLMSNAFLFFILGSLLAAYFGVLLVPLMAVVFGGLGNLYVLSTMPADVQLIGASGMVFWMGGAWLTLYLILDRRRTWVQRSLRAFGVGLVLFMPAEAFDPTISYQAHLVGFILGVAWALVYFLIKQKPLRGAEVYETEAEEPEEVPVPVLDLVGPSDAVHFSF
jgi:rhomboid protease GluP